MANPVNPNDPFRSPLDEADLDRPRRFDEEIQPDPELAEGRAGGGRIAIFAVAAVIVLGAVFYGLNSGPADPTRTATQSAPVSTGAAAPRPPAPTDNIANSTPPVAPGVRDVTPTSSVPGITTGAAPARPQAPSATPTGTEVDQSKKGSAN
ncbi:hypothetical protein BH11PSE4_BH11PSE4_27350 [soil metagenome]